MTTITMSIYKVTALTLDAKPTRFQAHQTIEGLVEEFLLFGQIIIP